MVQLAKTDTTTRLFSLSEPAQWRSFLPASRSVFGSVEFCTAVRNLQGLDARLFVFSDSPLQIAYPFFLREIDTLPYCTPGERGWDIKSPEYTGPVPLGPVAHSQAASFRQAFTQMCSEQGIIAEFAHLHPWAGSQALLDPSGVQFDRQIVYIDLTLPSERMWEEAFSHACRKNIRRAQRENVRVFAAQTAAEIEEFYRIYIGTMDRNQASDHYYFPLSYFTEIMEALPDQTLMLLAEYQDQIVAGTLYMHDDDSMYSYLGGADQDFQQIRPTNGVIYTAIQWGQAQGKKRLILGGGYQPDDGIFRFKSSFSPLRADFCVYRAIHSNDAYRGLCQAWADYYKVPVEQVRFFPQYRAGPPSGTVTISAASEFND